MRSGTGFFLCIFHIFALCFALSCGGSGGSSEGSADVLSKSSDCCLAELDIEDAGSVTISREFFPEQTSYEVTVDVDISSIRVKAVGRHLESTVLVNNRPVDNDGLSDDIRLLSGTNRISVHVIAENSEDQQTYELIVTRESGFSKNANLSGFNIDPADSVLEPSVEPEFQPEITSYVVSLDLEEPGVRVMPFAADEKASIKINNSSCENGEWSEWIMITEDVSSVSIEVTAEDVSVVKTYQLLVIRGGENTSLLRGLKMFSSEEEVTFSTDFVFNDYEYNATVPVDTEYVTIVPTAASGSAVISIGGQTVASGMSSNPVDLVYGSNVIEITVTAPDDSRTVYSVTVVRESPVYSQNANLSSLELSCADLNPVFSSTGTEYRSSVGPGTTQAQIRPVIEDSTASVSVNGSAVASGSFSQVISLVSGENEIIVSVTAEDVSVQKDYRVVITRTESAGVWEGDFYIFCEAERDVLSRYQRITGSLYIQNNADLVSLNGLEGLESIGGYLYLQNNSALLNIAGLSGLQSIGGGLIITGNLSAESFSLPQLESVSDDVFIKNNPACSGIFFDSLVSTGAFCMRDMEDCAQLSVPELSTIGGECEIFNNSELGFIAFPGLVSVNGSVNVHDNSNLTGLDLSADPDVSTSLSISRYFYCISNPALDHIRFHNRTAISSALDFVINDNTLLTEISFFDASAGIVIYPDRITAGGSMTISGNPGLTGLNFYCNAAPGFSVGSTLEISDCSALQYISGLSTLTSLGGSFIVKNNPVLASLTGVENIETIGGSLQLTDLAGLATLGAFSELREVEVSLEFTGCAALTGNAGELRFARLMKIGQDCKFNDLDSLCELYMNNLKSIGNDMSVNDLDALRTLSMINLESIGNDMYIDENDVLDLILFNSLDCSAHYLYARNNPELCTSSLEELAGRMNLWGDFENPDDDRCIISGNKVCSEGGGD